MALAALADMGAGGITLLALFLVSLLAGLAGLVGLALWLDYMLRPRGDHTRRAGLDVVASLAPRPAQSFDIKFDEEWTEARWQRQFRAHHSTAEVFAAEAQAGGWVSGPGLPAPDWPPDYPGYGWPDDPGGLPPVPGPPATGPDEHGRGLVFLSAAPPPVRPTDPSAGLVEVDRRCETLSGPALVLEVAHEEDSGPAPVVVPPPAPAEWAGPVPPTPELLAQRAQVRAWCSEMDADRVNYLHDYAAELRAA